MTPKRFAPIATAAAPLPAKSARRGDPPVSQYDSGSGSSALLGFAVTGTVAGSAEGSAGPCVGSALMLTMRGGGDAGTSIAARTAARLTRACIADAQLGESVIGHAERRAERCYAVLHGVTRCYRRAISAGVWCCRCQSSVEGATRRPAPSRSGALLPCCIHTELCRKLINYWGGSVIGHASEVQSPSARSSHRGRRNDEKSAESDARGAPRRAWPLDGMGRVAPAPGMPLDRMPHSG